MAFMALTSTRKRLLYDLLFRTGAENILEVARDPKNFCADIGLLARHTWRQNLQHYPHTIVSAQQQAHPTDPSSWGSHDRVLTSYGNSGSTYREAIYPTSRSVIQLPASGWKAI
jgi:hypothetical protein